MAIEIDYTFNIDGFFQSINYYRSEIPIDINNPPTPTQTGILGNNYIDTTAEASKIYHVVFSTVKNATEKFSVPIVVNTSSWGPDKLNPVLNISADSVTVLDGKAQVLINLSDSEKNAVLRTNTVPATIAQWANGAKKLIAVDHGGYTVKGLDNVLNNKNKWYVFAVINLKYKSSGDNTVLAIRSGTSGIRAGLMSAPDGRLYLGGRRLDSEGWQRCISPASYFDQNIIVLGRADTLARRLELYVNGALTVALDNWQTSGNISNTNSLEFSVMCGQDGLHNFNGEISSLVFSNTEIAENDRQKLEGWAAHKYGLAQNLPASHQYKTRPP